MWPTAVLFSHPDLCWTAYLCFHCLSYIYDQWSTANPLDQLITATALPSITAAFNGLDKLSWVASGFFLTLLGFTLIYSQWSQIFPSKVVIMFAIVIFELGSLICGVAPSMDVLILGRAVAGVGAAGIFSGGMLIIAELTPLSKRAQYFGLFGVW